MDFITDLPPSKDRHGSEYDAILVLVDRFTKYSQYLPVNKTITAKGLADLIKGRCFLRMGPPATIITDRGSVFTSQFWSDLCYHMKIDHRFSTAFHPQTDGQTERQNQELETYLRLYLNWQQDNWCELLPYAEYAYNSKQHSSHYRSPIEVAYGMKPLGFDEIPDEHWLRSPDELRSNPGRDPDLGRRVSQYLSDWKTMWQEAHEALLRAQESQRLYYNRKHEDMQFKEGEMVTLNRVNLKSRRPSKKLDTKYFGPFRIAQKLGPVTYRLELPTGLSRIHNVFHAALLERWIDPGPERNFQPGPIEHPEAEDPPYEVEAIIDHKTVDGKTLYNVKWSNWGPEFNTWEPEENLDDCQQALQEYLEGSSAQTSRKRKRSSVTGIIPTRRRSRK